MVRTNSINDQHLKLLSLSDVFSLTTEISMYGYSSYIVEKDKEGKEISAKFISIKEKKNK